MRAEPQKEHQWFRRFVGEWTFEGDAKTTPGEPPEKFKGTESVRSLEGIWVVAGGQGDMPSDGPATTIMTLGYDPQRRRYVGTWIGPMSSHLWIYKGELDAAGRVLTLNTEGPDMAAEGKIATFRDTIERSPPSGLIQNHKNANRIAVYDAALKTDNEDHHDKSDTGRIS